MGIRKVRESDVSNGLGDWIESTLTTVGITSERVEKWLGKPCRCRERKEKLNRFSKWISNLLSGEPTSKAKEEFDTMVNDGESSSPST